MKNILLGITGGIAAYKSPDLVRRLRARGMSVKVVLTESAKEFVTETTLQAVSSNSVRSSLWDKEAEAAMSHIELARWADCILISPTTANFMAKLVQGSAEDLLTTLCLATKSPIVIAPAMNHVMWDNISVQENKKTLQKRGVQVIGPEFGEQACGEIGFGRMPEPLAIVDFLFNQVIDIDSPLKGKKIMITAGPTREAIDPVRYISNRSSGKMGYALASEFIEKGADVLLVTGPTNLTVPKRITSIAVESAKEMHKAVHDNIVGVDIFVSSAAVSDYQTENTCKKKIKKKDEKLTLNLVKSPDILASVSNMKQSPFSVGFAAETENLKEYALDKLNQKSLDLIIANEVGPHKGFDQDENAVHVFWKHGEKVFEKLQKRKLAKHLVELIAARFLNKDQESDSTLSNVTSIR